MAALSGVASTLDPSAHLLTTRHEASVELVSAQHRGLVGIRRAQATDDHGLEFGAGRGRHAFCEALIGAGAVVARDGQRQAGKSLLGYRFGDPALLDLVR